jgi:hypothetical protein
MAGPIHHVALLIQRAQLHYAGYVVAGHSPWLEMAGAAFYREMRVAGRDMLGEIVVAIAAGQWFQFLVRGMGYSVMTLDAGHVTVPSLGVCLFLDLERDGIPVQFLGEASFLVAFQAEGIGGLHSGHGLYVGLPVARPALLWSRFLG